jgi:hypothetical protein
MISSYGAARTRMNAEATSFSWHTRPVRRIEKPGTVGHTPVWR